MLVVQIQFNKYAKEHDSTFSTIDLKWLIIYEDIFLGLVNVY